MQYDERKTLPESTQKYLVQQVQEQSDVCDVTVKMGHWEKKFHRCVLAASPFFENILRNNFLEKETGTIEVKLGTPICLEMAIMFLYGERPNLTDDNIEYVLHLAEFLHIPNLKSACISWLKTSNITQENCITFLQLSSVYGFEISKCTEYIEAHYSEMLRHSQMVNLAKDSINSLFLGRKLVNVPMDEKLMFLLRWRDAQPDKRNVFMKELLSAIDFLDVTKSLLQQLREDHSLKENIDVENILGNRVLLMKSERSHSSFWCFDIEREKWFRLSSKAYQKEENLNRYNVSGKGSNDFEICLTCKESGMLTLNLESDTCKIFRFVEKDSGEIFNQYNDLQIHGDRCFVNVIAHKKTNKDTSILNDFQRHLRYMSLLSGDRRDHVLAIQMMQNSDPISRYISILYNGNMADDMVRMSPFLTFEDHQVSNICVHNDLTIAILFKSNTRVSIFDPNDHSLEKLEVMAEDNDKIAQSEDGFVIFNGKRCICLNRLTGPSNPTKYNIKKIFLDKKCFYGKYYFFDNIWYHYYQKCNGEVFKFESALHSCAISEGSMKNVTWKPLPLPIDADSCNGDTIKDNVVQIRVPKRKLCCDIECPHCKSKMASRESTSERRTSASSSSDDSDDYFYNELPDDNFYIDSFYDLDYIYTFYDSDE